SQSTKSQSTAAQRSSEDDVIATRSHRNVMMLQTILPSCLLSRNTACSPIRFQNHQGALKRSSRPQALSATARSILAPATSLRWRKFLIVQKWMLGVSHQL